jgi:uncharacterized protein
VKIRPLLCSILASACVVSGVAGGADDPRTLTWEELSVKLSIADNPFARMSPEQLMALGDVAAIRDRRSRGVVLSAEEISIERDARTALERDKVDIDGLLAQRESIAKKMRAATGAVNPALDGAKVRMAGYVLPLEFSGKKVSEFLLVPWVGACIHTPPPEANQIVYVKPDKPFDVDGMFQAVWVTGRMRTASSTRAVTIVDGSSNVDVGYALQADKVERY